MMNKRGISPLIATILLIVLSVGMGVAVMSWGEQYIEAKAEFAQGVQETITSCDLVQLSIVTIANAQQMCLLGNTIKGLIDNGPDVDVSDIHARVIGEKGVSVRENLLSQSLPRGSAAQVAFPIEDIGAVSQIKFTPKIMISGKPVICTKQAIVAENLKPC